MHKHRPFATLLGVIGALTMVSPASTQSADPPSRNFGTICTSGSLRACASVRIWNQVNPLTQQFDLFVEIANLQGWGKPGLQDLQRSGLSNWSLNGLMLQGVPTFGLELALGLNSPHGLGDAGTTTCVPYQNLCETGSVHSRAEYSGVGPSGVSYHLGSDSFNLLWGCDGPSDPNAYLLYSMSCGGYVTWRMSLGQNAGYTLTKETNVSLGFLGDHGTGASSSCITGLSPEQGGCLSVVPEPGTWALLATGLFGIGGASALRRRRERRIAAGGNTA